MVPPSLSKRTAPHNAESSKKARIAHETDASGGRTHGNGDDVGGGDLDIEDQDRKRMQQGRRGRVVTEASESEDESDLDEYADDDDYDEDPGGRSHRHGKRGRHKAGDKDGENGSGGEGEDDDMFALDGEGAGNGARDADDGALEGNDKRKTRFLDLGEIEGQEFGTGDLASDDDEDRDRELELEEDDEEEDGDEAEYDDEALFDANAAGERSPPRSPGGTVIRRPSRREKRQAQSRSARSAAKGRGGNDAAESHPMDGDMGFKLDAFNMKEEMATGRFDEEGNYIPNSKDPHAQHDNWLTGNYSRKGIRAAKDAHIRREAIARSREANEDANSPSEVETKRRLAMVLEKEESVLEALQRLGKASKKEQQKQHQRQKQHQKQQRVRSRSGNRRSTSQERDSMAVDDGKDASKAPNNDASLATETPLEPSDEYSKLLKALEEVTSCSSLLMSRYGLLHIYDETYEGLVRAVRRSGNVPDDWDPAAERQHHANTTKSNKINTTLNTDNTTDDPRRFRYRWAPEYLVATSGEDAVNSQENNNVSTFGPFSVAELQTWAASGYFGGASCERILLQQVENESGNSGGRNDPEESTAWHKWEEVL